VQPRRGRSCLEWRRVSDGTSRADTSQPSPRTLTGAEGREKDDSVDDGREDLDSRVLRKECHQRAGGSELGRRLTSMAMTKGEAVAVPEPSRRRSSVKL